MRDTIQTTLTMEMQPELIQKTCQTLSSSLEDFLAKLSVLLENEEDLTKQEEHYFLRLQGFYETKKLRAKSPAASTAPTVWAATRWLIPSSSVVSLVSPLRRASNLPLLSLRIKPEGFFFCLQTNMEIVSVLPYLCHVLPVQCVAL